MADPNTLLATPPATTTTTAAPATITTTATGASTQTPTQPPQPSATEGDKSLLGGAPKPEQPAAMQAAEKLYGKLVEKVVEDGQKKSAAEPAKTETKPAEPAKPEAVKPAEGSAVQAEIKYDLKAPDGSLLAPADVEKVTSLAKEAKLAPELAQKVVEAESQAVKSYQERLLADFRSTSRVKWVDDLKADKEFGGERFNETVELAKRGFHAYASPAFIQLMNDTGYGNHPEVIKTFARIGKERSEGRFVTGGQPVAVKKSAAEKLYGDSMGKK